MMIEVLPKQSWHDQRLMDYMKSGVWEPGMVMECCEWVEGMEIGVGMKSNISWGKGNYSQTGNMVWKVDGQYK